MDHDTKEALATLTKTMHDGFASLETRMEKGFTRMDKGFAAVAEGLADIKDRLPSVESKIIGTNRRLRVSAEPHNLADQYAMVH